MSLEPSIPLHDQVITLQLVVIVATVAIAAVALTWWLSRQFRETRDLFYRVISLHNREDDDRFEALSNEIWQAQIREARRYGEELPPRRTMPRRRYLSESEPSIDDLSRSKA